MVRLARNSGILSGILATALLLACSGRVTSGDELGGDEDGALGTSEESGEESGEDTEAEETGEDGDGDGDGDGNADESESEGDGDGDDDGPPYCQPTGVDQAEIDTVEDNLMSIVQGAIAYFNQVQPEGTPHLCPHPDGAPAGGEAGVTPDINFDCNCGPEARCIPEVGGGGGGYYDVALWLDNNVWSGANWLIEPGTPHAFKYNLIIVNEGEGEGACAFTAVAHADFDGDAEFSTYSISGFVDPDGAQIEEMVVEMPFE